MKTFLLAVFIALVGVFSAFAQVSIVPTLLTTTSEFGIETGAENYGWGYADFLFHFSIKAVGGDVYVKEMGGHIDLSNSVEFETYQYKPGYTVSLATQVPGDQGPLDLYYFIPAGGTETFSVDESLDSSIDTEATGFLTGIHWNTIPSNGGTPGDTWNAPIEPLTWQADPVFIQGATPEPSTMILTALGLVGIVLRRRR